MQENTFLIVGSYMIIFDELREHKAQINQLEVLKEKISQGCIHNQAEESVWRYDYVNYELDSIPIKDLLDYFIPDAEERKTSDRNTIKARIKTIREVLRYVIICPDFEDIREIKMLYREFYIERNGLLGSSKYASFLKILEEQDEYTYGSERLEWPLFFAQKFEKMPQSTDRLFCVRMYSTGENRFIYCKLLKLRT